MRCSFTEFDIHPKGVSVRFSADGDLRYPKPVRVWFEIEPGDQPAIDLVALACSTLAGSSYDHIHIDLPLAEITLSAIGDFASATITALPQSDADRSAHAALQERRASYEGLALSFSGGMDSLGMLGVLPIETHLVSMDWGGSFSREKPMFQRFSPHVVRSNLVSVGLNRNCTEFMGTGILLLADRLELSDFAFGSVIESLFGFFNRQSPRSYIYEKPFVGAGMQHAGFATGLSEIGTTRLCCHYSPDHVPRSIDSLAAPGSIKRTRKQLLVAIDGAKHGHSLTSQEIDNVWGRIPRWGEETVDDFVTLYILKHLGDSAMHYRATDIPESVRSAAQELRLTFMERFDPELLNTIPDRYRARFVDLLNEAGIALYSDGDLDEFYAVGDLLRETRVPKPDSHSRPHPVAVALNRLGLHTLIDPARRIRAFADRLKRH